MKISKVEKGEKGSGCEDNSKKREKYKLRYIGMNVCEMVRRLVQLHPKTLVEERQQRKLVRG